MPYGTILGLTPTLMSVGLLGKNIGSATKKGGSMLGMGVRTLVGVPLISSVSGLIKGL